MFDWSSALPQLQFLVLDCIGSSEISGRGLRAKLASAGAKKTGPAFYQLMSRLEEAKYVDGWYEQKIVAGQIIRERRYRLRSEGADAYNATLRFYNRPELRSRSLPGLNPTS